MSEALWRPSPERIARARLTAFSEFAQSQYAAPAGDYGVLYRWSTGESPRFWEALWEYCGVVASRGADRVLSRPDSMPGARWFEGARLNFAENLLRHSGDRPALVFRNERGDRMVLSFSELRQRVAGLRQALADSGVGPGDRVAGIVANRPEAVIAMLATTSLGAVWSSCSPDFGVNGIVDRFGQIAPKVLFATDGYYWNGKAIDSLPRVAEALARLSDVQRIVIIPYVREVPSLQGLRNAVHLADYAAGEGALSFAQLPFDHPLYILYSSGTTGAPKCIVHGAGGTLIQHLKELVLHTDVGPDDCVFYFTTCGWMMWNWLVSTLATGATTVLYDGSPFHPGPEVLWDMAQEERVTVFGTSARYLSALEKSGLTPRSAFDIEPLRCVLSTGSPLAPASFDYVYRDIAPELQLSSISGGTDIVSCFALGNPVLPVYRGELQCRGLGMRVEIFDEGGNSVREEKGELVCTAPFPSMPVGFWNDPDGNRYHDAYFARFPGVWCHGDYAELTAHDGVIIHGRSDAVLNPGGVRIGTAEIYRQVEKLDEVLESVAVGQDWEGDVRVVLLVRLRDGMALDEDLEARIRQVIRAGASPRHVPAKIAAVPDIPRTISGKIVELAVRDTIHGRPVGNIDALANPQALEYFRDIPELQQA